jgi:uncharacterized protein (DUF2249 family)
MNGPKHKTRTLDVRGLMARGEQPLPTILGAFAALADGQSLLLITPFIPSPLIERVQSEGFEARPERRPDGAWQTNFAPRASPE